LASKKIKQAQIIQKGIREQRAGEQISESRGEQRRAEESTEQRAKSKE
jgi:hypothetical protein